MEIQPHEWDDFLKEMGSDSFFSPVVDDARLGYSDPLATQEQRLRDKKITTLLDTYIKAYQKKVKSSTWYRRIILVACLVIVAGFAVLLGYISSHIVSLTSAMETQDLIAFITVCISFVSLVFGLLTIITKYFFPDNDEQYITKIVEAIQNNDLENKKLAAKWEEKTSVIDDDQ